MCRYVSRVGTEALPEPPVEQWSRQGAIHTLSRFAADLHDVDGEEASSWLGRLTDDQRSWVLHHLEAWGAGPTPDYLGAR